MIAFTTSLGEIRQGHVNQANWLKGGSMKPLNLRDTIRRLKYIAESPAAKYGGFESPAIITAKAALHHLEKLRRAKEKAK